jgi:dienelactone hydrolase
MQKSKILIGVLILLQAAAVLSAQSLSAPAVTNVSFKGPGNVTLKAYLAVPAGKGPFPVVLLIHEWWGLTHNIRLLADALAAKGYVVLAADAFRGKVAGAPAEAGKLVQGTPAKQVTAFDRALKDKGVEHTITVYPGVGHAFVNAGNYNKSGTPQKARNRTLDFLKRTIGKTAGMM